MSACDPQPAADPQPAPARPARREALRTAGQSLRLLRRPFWARALLLVIALSVLFVILGRWQFGRHETKVTRNARIDSNYGAPVVPLGQVLAGPAATLPADQEWRPVQVGGHYQADRTVLIRNRPLEGVYGYEVIVPLLTDGGGVLLVDRGWLPNGQRSAAEPDVLPAPPAGHVQVVARLRPSEPPLDRNPPAGQEFRIDVPRITGQLGEPTYRAYAVLAQEQPAAATAPQLLPYPDLDLGPHLSYALQWWGFAVAAYGVLGWYLVKDARAGLSAAAPAEAPAAPDGPTPSRPAGPDGRRGPLAAARLGSRRREPTDEEWEDAADR